MTWKIINGNSSEILKQYPDNSFDCVITDPPYGIGFLGKDWDHNTGDRGVYEQCLRVLKPGGHLLAFSAARTYHHLAMTVETVGFEIRDQIMWIYGSGFPKSQDVGRQIQKSLGVKKTVSNPNHRTKDGDSLYDSGHQKTEIKGDVVCTDPLAQQWEGWGSQLKPAHEPIVMARKPMKNSIRENVQTYGTGAINIDATRVPYESDYDLKHQEDIRRGQKNAANGTNFFGTGTSQVDDITLQGRFPANVIMDDEAGQILDEQAPKVGNLFSGKRTKSSTTGSGHSLVKEKHEGEDNGVFDGLGGASRFFYCPKVSKKERNIGCETIEPKQQEAANFRPNHKIKADAGETGTPFGRFTPTNNNHPTVKPIELMKYLIKLVTPPNGHILDPFNGSGSTGCAAVELGFDYTGIELDPNYVDIATKRISYWENECKPKTTYNDLFSEE